MTKKHEHWDEMTVAELEKAVDEALGHLAKARALLPGLAPVTDDARGQFQRLRDGEDAAVLAILEAVDVRPALFESLADQDGGHDPKRFETDFLRDSLRKRDVLAKAARELAPFSQAVGDAILELGGDAKGPALAAYRIASGVRETDALLREKLKPASDFYGAIGRRSSATRAKKRSTG
jgi:hypothetical protein